MITRLENVYVQLRIDKDKYASQKNKVALLGLMLDTCEICHHLQAVDGLGIEEVLFSLGVDPRRLSLQTYLFLLRVYVNENKKKFFKVMEIVESFGGVTCALENDSEFWSDEALELTKEHRGFWPMAIQEVLAKK